MVKVASKARNSTACDFLRAAVAAHRGQRVAQRFELGALFGREARDPHRRCGDEAGADGVDADTARQQLGGEGRRHGDQRRLGRGIHQHAGDAAGVGDRGREYNRAAIGDQRGQPLHGKEGAADVDRKLPIERVFVDLREGLQFGDTSIHMQKVDAV